MTERRYTSDEATCSIFTFKEGMLAAVAHDLELRVESLRLTVAVPDREDTPSIEATFDPSSIRVVSAMRDGRRAPELLGSHNFPKIEASLHKEVLEVRRYPEVRFASTRVTRESQGYRIEGDLTLHGRTRAIRCLALREGDTWRAEVQLHQPDYDIRPFTAMLGTLRVKPKVTVVVEVSDPGLGDRE